MPMTQQLGATDKIDVNDEQACAQWARKFDTTEDELRDAVRAVGDRAADVEMHLKGSRTTTNSERVKEELDRR